MSLVGKNLGADEEWLAMRTGHIAGRVALITAAIVAVCLLIFQKIILDAFTSNSEVIRYGSAVIYSLAILQIPRAVNIVFSGNLRGGADLAWLMWLAIGSVILFEIMGVYTLTHFFHISLAGIWIIQGVDEGTRFALNYFRFKGGKWKGLNM